MFYKQENIFKYKIQKLSILNGTVQTILVVLLSLNLCNCNEILNQTELNGTDLGHQHYPHYHHHHHHHHSNENAFNHHESLSIVTDYEVSPTISNVLNEQ